MASKDGSRLFEQGDYNADVKLLLAFKQQQAEPLPAGVVGLHAPVEPIAARPSSMPAPTPTPPPHPSPSHPSPRRSEGATPSRGYRDYAPPAVQTVFQPEPSPPQPVDPDSDAARASAAHESRLASARSTAAAWSHATTPLGAGASSARVAVDDHAATPRDVAAGNPRVAADGAPTDAPRGRLRTSPRAALGAAKPNATTTAAGAEPAAASRRQHIQSCREYVHALLASAQAAGEEVPLWKAELATRAANRHEPIRSARRPVQLDHAKLVEMRASLRSEPSSPARGAGGARSQRRASGAAAAAERATADVEALAALRRSSSVESSAEQQRRRLLEWHCDSGSDDDELRAPTRARLRGLRESCDETLDRIEDAELETQSLLEKLGVAREAVERATAAVRETHREDAADDERRKRRDVQTQRAILFEKRVEEARARNRAIKAVVADLRAERRVFTAKTRRADARSAEMDADIKLFARQAAEALDEGERSEFQLRRVEFDVLAEERAHVALLRAEEAREVRLDHDVLVAERAERKAVELERRAGYALLHDIRRHDEAFQTRRDYLRAQVRAARPVRLRVCIGRLERERAIDGGGQRRAAARQTGAPALCAACHQSARAAAAAPTPCAGSAMRSPAPSLRALRASDRRTGVVTGGGVHAVMPRDGHPLRRLRRHWRGAARARDRQRVHEQRGGEQLAHQLPRRADRPPRRARCLRARSGGSDRETAETRLGAPARDCCIRGAAVG